MFVLFIVKMNNILQCLFNIEISDNLKVNFIIYTMKKFGACVFWAVFFLSFLAGKLPRFQQMLLTE